MDERFALVHLDEVGELKYYVTGFRTINSAIEYHNTKSVWKNLPYNIMIEREFRKKQSSEIMKHAEKLKSQTLS